MTEIPHNIDYNDSLKQNLLSLSDLKSIPDDIGEGIVEKHQGKLDSLNAIVGKKISDYNSTLSSSITFTFGNDTYKTNDKIKVSNRRIEGNMLYEEDYITTSTVQKVKENNYELFSEKKDLNNDLWNNYDSYNDALGNNYNTFIKNIKNLEDEYVNITEGDDNPSSIREDYNITEGDDNPSSIKEYNDIKNNLYTNYYNKSNNLESDYNDKKNKNESEYREKGDKFKEIYEIRKEEIQKEYIDNKLKIDKEYNEIIDNINNEISDIDEKIDDNDNTINYHEGLQLGKMESSILDAMVDPNNNGKTVLQILGDKYKDGTESEKIELAQVLTAYMVTNYDDTLLDTNIGENGKETVSTEEMFEIYKKGGNAGVCRHIARAGAQLLDKLGFNAGIVSVTSSIAHAITWGKKEDGSYFLIDYGKLFEAKSPKELLSAYGSSKKTVDLQNFITDENGEYTGTITTAEGKQMQLNTSSLDTPDIFKHTNSLNKEGIDIINGHDFDIGFTNNGGKKISYKYGNGSFEIGGDYSQNKNVGQYINSMDTMGVFAGAKVGNMNGSFGELGFKVKLSQTDIDFKEGSNTYQNISANIDWVKNLYKSDNTKINFSSSIYGNGGSIKGENAFGTDTFKGGFLSTLGIENIVNDNLSWDASANIGGDFISKNMADSTGKVSDIDFATKWGIGGNMNYTTDYGDSFSVGGSYEKGLGYTNKSFNLGVESGKFSAEGYYGVEDNTESGFGVKEKHVGVDLAYDITDSLQFTGYVNKTDDGVTKHSNVGVGLQYKF